MVGRMRNFYQAETSGQSELGQHTTQRQQQPAYSSRSSTPQRQQPPNRASTPQRQHQHPQQPAYSSRSSTPQRKQPHNRTSTPQRQQQHPPSLNWSPKLQMKPRQQQQQQQHQHQHQHVYRQDQAASPKSITMEQYQANRRIAANTAPERQRNTTPQRQRNKPIPQRAPPPGKFAQQQQHPYDSGQQPRYHPGQNPQYHQHPQQYFPTNHASQMKQTMDQNFINQQQISANTSDEMKHMASMQHNALHNNMYQEQRQPMSRRDYYEQAQTRQKEQMFQMQQGQRQAVDLEDQYNMHLMREREAEVAAINEKVNKVNDIYTDLAGLIEGQQDLIEKVDMNIEESHAHTKSGVTNYAEARFRMENPMMQDPFGDNLGKRPDSARPKTPRDAGKRRVKNAREKNKRKISSTYEDDDDIDCQDPFETMQEDLKDVINDMKSFGARIFLACTAPENDYDKNEYATYR